jgi:hypothetical protein
LEAIFSKNTLGPLGVNQSKESVPFRCGYLSSLLNPLPKCNRAMENLESRLWLPRVQRVSIFVNKVLGGLLTITCLVIYKVLLR